MVDVEVRNGFYPLSESPTNNPPRGLGYTKSPQNGPTEYSGPDKRPIFGMAPAKRYRRQERVITSAKPLCFEKREQTSDGFGEVPFTAYPPRFIFPRDLS